MDVPSCGSGMPAHSRVKQQGLLRCGKQRVQVASEALGDIAILNGQSLKVLSRKLQ